MMSVEAGIVDRDSLGFPSIIVPARDRCGSGVSLQDHRRRYPSDSFFPRLSFSLLLDLSTASLTQLVNMSHRNWPHHLRKLLRWYRRPPAACRLAQCLPSIRPSSPNSLQADGKMMIRTVVEPG